MNWRVEWAAISARIAGIADAANFFFNTLVRSSVDNYSVVKSSLLPQTGEIHQLLVRFASTQSKWIPQEASCSLDRFLRTRAEVFSGSEMDARGALQFCVAALIAFRAEFEYHISDFAVFARRQSERAFAHLQRSIVVDDEERERWMTAFEKNEIACEKLGAVRLLAHGIWAFKVDGVGERTDLVFQEALAVDNTIGRAADALVLTEWKCCQSQPVVRAKLAEAKAQATKYRAGVLAGMELVSYRYLVLVSRKDLEMPADDTDDGVVFRHVNIAVDPATPSETARAKRVSRS